MAIKMIDGFNTYGLGSEITGGLWSGSYLPVIDVGGGQYSGNALKLTSGKQMGLAKTGTGTETDYHRVGFSFKITSLTAAVNIFRVSRYSGSSTSTSYVSLGLQITATGSVRFLGDFWVERWAGSEPIFTEGVWYYVEIGYQIAVAGALDLYVNGVLIKSYLGRFQVSSYDNYPSLLSAGVECYFDNFYFATDTSMPPALGDCRVETLITNGDTAQADFTGSVLDIDDPIGFHDGDTSYISSATLNDKSEFDLTNLPYTPNTIHAVQAFTDASTDGIGARGITPYILSVATPAEDVEHLPTVGEYFHYPSVVWEDDPNTAGAWTELAVNTLKIGVELTM